MTIRKQILLTAEELKYNAEELIAELDEKGNVIGSMKKEEAFLKGRWFEGFFGWAVNLERGTIVLQLRANKKVYPHKLTNTMTGHIEYKEDARNSGKREAQEELGLLIPKDDFVYIGTYMCVADLPKGLKIRQHCRVYLTEISNDLLDYNQAEREVDGMFEISPEEMIKLFSGTVKRVEIYGVLRNSKSRTTRVVSIDDFVDNDKKMYLAVANLVKSKIKGEAVAPFNIKADV